MRTLRIAGVTLQGCVIGALLFFSFCDWRNVERPAKSSSQLSSPSTYLLPDTAYRLNWDLGGIPVVFQPGVSRSATVRVTNASSSTWPSIQTTKTSPPGAYCIRISYRWWDANRENVVVDYSARTNLPKALPPGEMTALSLEIRPPAQPGHYVLQVDLVHEMICWFEGRGAARGLVDVHVRP